MTYDNMAALSLQTGELDAAEVELDRSLDARRQAKDAIGLSRGLYSQAKLLFSRGRVAEAQARIAESIEIKKKMEDDEGIAKCRELEGQILFERDQWKAALQAFGEAIAVYEGLRMGFKTHRIRLACARVHLAMGQDMEADALVEAVSAPDETRMDAATKIDLALVEADIARRARKFAAAESLLAKVLPTLQDVKDDALENQVAFLSSLIAMEVGGHDRAVSLLEARLARKACRDNPFVAAKFYNLLGKAQRKAGRLDSAEKTLREGLAVIQAIDDPLGEALAFDELGKVALDAERKSDARAWFQKGLAVKRRIDDARGIEISGRLLSSCD
jgi:tetratricopeptide (TPR) repeat protein